MFNYIYQIFVKLIENIHLLVIEENTTEKNTSLKHVYFIFN